jgi:hypothetical protein
MGGTAPPDPADRKLPSEMIDHCHREFRTRFTSVST